MIHFETIWNEAESVAKSYTNLLRKEILRKLRSGVDELADSDLPEEYHEAIGKVLFELCALCAHLDDTKKIQVNSATALADMIEKKRSELLDPDKPE